ncbi:type VII secretion integral membrane protein EccD [Allocatelliglobosispora scoriae]|uniref:Type VII secretion integral membrane protein EccD n=1 Tax=Allocatelliglobosispora scoriae TaxID=643052 RepID=A0A841BWD1_9ACTN|nr:type VII secretion integral membrane protein EccD [Allocatelliglobosispora scoriae]MBB5871233.1 type VII secretion integral membrane protein EccD [Allocatelliglobosispora scoriae]
MSIPSALSLARVTVNTPHRRVDVALPEQIPVVELLPDLLRHAGEGFADDGERHGGWLLRRADGSALAPERGLHAQGVRDGEVLHLVPARAAWPELEYDDVVEAIAEGARRRGAGWSAEATRTATVAGAAVLLAGGLLAIVQSGPQWILGGWIGLGTALVLLLSGVVAARAYGESRIGAALGGFALPYAFAGGALVFGSDTADGALGFVRWLGEPQLLVGAVAMLLFSTIGAVGIGGRLRIFTAGITIGLITAIAALLGMVLSESLSAADGAAVVVAILVCGIGLLPVLAVRFGKVPVPPITLPAGGQSSDGFTSASPSALDSVRRLPERSRVFAAVARSEELLAGMLIGYAALAIGAAVPLVATGGTAGRTLTAIAATALLLRSRLFLSTRHRVPLLTAGLATASVLLAGLILTIDGPGRTVLALGAVALALIVVVAGQAWSHTPPSPYIGRLADLFEMAVVVSVVPVACWVLDLYALARGLSA